MPQILCQMFFESKAGSRPCGWSEGHYNLTATTLPDALTQLVTLATFRSLLLGAGVTMPYLRVSERTVFRDSQVDYGPAPGFTLIPPTAPGALWGAQAITGAGGLRPLFPLYEYGYYQVTQGVEIPGIICDFPWASYLVRMEGSADIGGSNWTARRAYHIRGNPDIVQQTLTDRIDGTTGIPAAALWRQRMQDYANVLIGQPVGGQVVFAPGTWGFKSLDTSGANPAKAITGIAVDPATGKVTLTVPLGNIPGPPPIVGIVLNQNDMVRISGLRVVNGLGTNLKSLNRLWQVESVNGNAITFYNMKLPTGGIPYSIAQGGTLRKQIYGILPYRKVQPRWFAEKKTGSPFGVPVGRRSKRLQAALGTA